ncbi:MAG: LacI family DNA-binding transcriptional regulator [Candidatus Kappaea frigidicola]|nr:LacI family DNA-binding transcriptional regulator [Candidatus Kappaea frigidicola]
MSKTLKEIGKELNISRFTISRVLNGSKDVSEETRKKILQYLKDNPYYPNANANRLHSGKVNVIGLIFTGKASVIFESYVQQIIEGVSEVTRKKDFYLMLFMQDELDYKECYSLYMSKQVGGFILPGVDRKKHAGIKCLVKEKIPLAIVCSRLDNICSFDCDNVRGGYLATKHLIKKGRKRIAYLHGHKGWVDAEDRFEGYKKALKEEKMKLNIDYVKYNYGTRDSGFEEKATRELLKLKERPDAIFTATDNMALVVMKTLKKAKIEIPDDIALVGFDDIPLTQAVSPALTTIRQPIGQMAKEATLNVIKQIDNKKAKGVTFFKPELIVRESS